MTGGGGPRARAPRPASGPLEPAADAAASPHTPHEFGRCAEAYAAEHVVRAGWEILARGARAGGVEVDLIARRRTGRRIQLAFIEVRARTSAARGHPLETIDARKRRRLSRGAAAWLAAHPEYAGAEVQLDVIAIVGERPDWTLVHVERAFDAVD